MKAFRERKRAMMIIPTNLEVDMIIQIITVDFAHVVRIPVLRCFASYKYSTRYYCA